jgi:dTMP kinase
MVNHRAARTGGVLITFEGIDGSGKTTVWEALRDADPFDRPTTFTREPTTDSWYGEAVSRSLADNGADPLAELFLYTADHAAHLSRVVEPALEEGEIVCCDRYVDSRYAYQALAIEGRIDRPLEYVMGLHAPWTIRPDLTIYLDVDPDVGAGRSAGANKFEQRGFLAGVQANYERLIEAEADRFVRIDAERPPETVLGAVEEQLRRVLE